MAFPLVQLIPPLASLIHVLFHFEFLPPFLPQAFLALLALPLELILLEIVLEQADPLHKSEIQLLILAQGSIVPTLQVGTLLLRSLVQQDYLIILLRRHFLLPLLIKYLLDQYSSLLVRQLTLLHDVKPLIK